MLICVLFLRSCPDESSRAALKLVCDLYALDRIWNDIGTYRNVDYVAPNKAKVLYSDLFFIQIYYTLTTRLVNSINWC